MTCNPDYIEAFVKSKTIAVKECLTLLPKLEKVIKEFDTKYYTRNKKHITDSIRQLCPQHLVVTIQEHEYLGTTFMVSYVNNHIECSIKRIDLIHVINKDGVVNMKQIREALREENYSLNETLIALSNTNYRSVNKAFKVKIDCLFRLNNVIEKLDVELLQNYGFGCTHYV